MFKKIFIKHDRKNGIISIKRGLFGNWSHYQGYTEAEAINDFIQGLA